MKRGLILIGVLLWSVYAFAQITPSRRPTDNDAGGFNNNDFGNRSDTTRLKGGLKNGKLLDDSTKSIYGPTTARYIYEKDIKYNRPVYHTIDTLIDQLHRFNYVNANQNLYQDLGNIGTASAPIYYQLPDQIGVSSGLTLYDLYARGPDDIKYYNTRSPFSDLNVVIGGEGRAITDVKYSRNIKPNWNFGFDYRGLFIDKQLQKSGKGDRQVLSNMYDVYTHYITKDSVYQVLANFSRNRHKVTENGGALVSNSALLPLYFEDNVQINLQSASTTELRTNLHIYQQYKFSDLIQAYHQIDRHKQQNTFKDDLSVDGANYDTAYLDTDNTFDRIDFHTTTSEQGVKGDLGPFFYNVYHKWRYFDIDYNTFHSDTVDLVESGNEQYGGARVRFDFDSLTFLEGDLEYLVGSNYQIGGRLKGRKYEFGFRRMQYEPSYVSNYYYGNHRNWDNDFRPVKVDELKAAISFSYKKLKVKPFVRTVLLNDYIMNLQDSLPGQVSDVQLINFGTEIKLDFLRNMHFEGMGIYSSVSGTNANVMQVPEVLINALLYYQNTVYDGNLQFQFGIDAHWKNAFFANGYDPSTQQFYLQNDFLLTERAAVDVFANLKINRGRLFLKYINLLKAFEQVGYFASPYYIGQVNVIDFGFKWAFYD